GTVAADRTANGNNGTLGGGTVSARPAWVAVSPAGSFSLNLQGGSLSGVGVVNGNVVNAAVVSPGTPTGVLALNGTYTQTSAGTLNVDLSGTTPGTQFDQVTVYGAAALDGTLNVSRLGGYTPNNGDTFKVLTFASRTGQFATVNGVLLGNNAG